MGETKSSRKVIRAELDRKLQLSPPSRDLLEDLALACSADPTNSDATFQYAFALSRSRQASELRYAVSMLDSLVADGYEHQVDCMVGAATALYLLGDYEESRSRCEAILRAQPQSRVAKELHLASVDAHEEREVKRMKQTAAASIGVAAAIGVAAGFVSLLMNSSK